MNKLHYLIGFHCVNIILQKGAQALKVKLRTPQGPKQHSLKEIDHGMTMSQTTQQEWIDEYNNHLSRPSSGPTSRPTSRLSSRPSSKTTSRPSLRPSSRTPRRSASTESLSPPNDKDLHLFPSDKDETFLQISRTLEREEQIMAEVKITRGRCVCHTTWRPERLPINLWPCPALHHDTHTTGYDRWQ